MDLVKKQGVSPEKDTRSVFFRGYGLWLGKGGGKVYLYPEVSAAATPGMHSLGMNGRDLKPSEQMLDKLVNLPAAPENGEGWGDGDMVQNPRMLRHPARCACSTSRQTNRSLSDTPEQGPWEGVDR